MAGTEGRGRLVPGLLAVLLVALVAVGVLLLRAYDQAPGSAVPDGMLVAARQEAVNFFSLDYRHAPADVDRVLALATGDFKQQYTARRDEVVNGVVRKKLVVTGSIPADGVAVEYLDAGHAQVLAAVDVNTASSSGGNDSNRYRARILLTLVQGRWLVSGLDQVG